MQTLHVVLCEDKTTESNQLLTLIQSSHILTQVTAFTSGEAFLAAFQPGMFDLILMDIYMDGMTGIEAVRQIRRSDPDVPVAFATISLEHALDAYRLDVIKYIEKPPTQKAIDDVLRLALYKKEQQPALSVCLHGKPFFIPAKRLLFAEQDAHYIQFHFVGGQVERQKGRLDELAPQLSGLPFYRCHKSYLANLAFVTGIDPEMRLFYMEGGKTVYIRREQYHKAKTAWESWLLKDMRQDFSNCPQNII